MKEKQHDLLSSPVRKYVKNASNSGKYWDLFLQTIHVHHILRRSDYFRVQTLDTLFSKKYIFSLYAIRAAEENSKNVVLNRIVTMSVSLFAHGF